MRKRKGKQGLAFVLALLISIHPAAVTAPWGPMVSYADGWSGKIKGTTVNVRSGPGTGYQAVDKLTNGTSVSVSGQQTGSDGKVWYQIQYGAGKTGYVRSDYVKQQASYSSDADFEAYLNSQGFPESYKDSLRQLHAEYPSWQFLAQHTGLDWADAVKNESVIGRNLVYLSSPSSWKSTAEGAYNWKTSTWPGFDSSSWVAASEEIISHYMDPRNFLDDKYIFQFLLHSYDSSVHTVDGLKTMVKGTFLEGSASVSGDNSTGSGSGPGAGSGSDSGISAAGPGSETSGEASGAGPGSSSGSGEVSTTGPGDLGGTGSSSGNSVTMTPPGGTVSGNSAPSGDSSSQAPSGSSGNSNVSLQPPGASLQARQSRILMNPLAPGSTAGPGGSGSASSGSSGIGPGGGMGPGGSGGGTGGSAPVADYTEIIMEAARQSGVNPYVLAAMIIQEQGKNGSGGSISGRESGYQGYYNFFNIEAYQSGSMTAVQRGLWYASQSGSYGRPWNSVDRAILGGAVYYGTNYVQVGQDTFYLKKFNVQGNNLYKHQYMTNIQGAAAEGAELSEAYSEEMKQTPLQFKIPVYYNMPEAACPKPTVDGSPNNKLSGLGVDGFRLTPTFDMDTTSYDLIVDPSVGYVDVAAAAYSSVASVSGTGRIQLQSGINEIVISVTAQNGAVRQYVIHVVRQNNGPTHDSSLGSGLSGGGSGIGPGGSTGPGSGSAGSSGSGNGSSGVGPGGSNSGSIDIVTGGEGPGGSSAGNGGSGTGPGGSHVTIVQ